MKKKLFCLLLACAMVLAALAACGGDQSSSVQQSSSSGAQQSSSGSSAPEETGGMPIVTEPMTLKIFAGKHATHANWEDMLVWKTYEELTGIHIEWDLVDTTNLAEVRNIRLVGGEYPDVFFQAQLSAADLMTYGSQGAFIPLNDLIDQYAPNIKAIFDAQPEVRKLVTMPDGNIYSLPTVTDPAFTSVQATLKFWVSEDWLAQTNMDKPETTEDFYEYLKAVKALDPDVVPLTSHSFKWLRNSMRGAFGVANRGNNHDYVGQDDATGELVFSPVTENWKAMVEYLNKLYSEELLAQDIFSMDYATYVAAGTEGRYASFVAVSPTLFGIDEGYRGDMVLEGPFGDKFAGMYASTASNPGSFVITNANQNPIETIKWIDYLYSKEGSLLYFMGVEGETYTVDADGSVQYVDDILNNPDGLTLDQAVGQFTSWPGGYYPAVLSQDYFRGAETSPAALAAAEYLKDYKPKEVWNAFTYTEEENAEMAALQGDIHKYVDEMTSQFVSGVAGMDKWDEYVRTIEQMGLERYMEIYNQAYQRYANS